MKNQLTNKRPKITYIDFCHKAIPYSFEGFKVLHLSDLHNKEFGLNQSILIEMTKELKPDIIAFTGDMVYDGRIDKTLIYFEQAIRICPVYAVSGNHEYYHRRYFDNFKERLTNLGVNLLENRAVEINREGEIINIIGVNDVNFFKNKKDFAKTIDFLTSQAQGFKILLSHMPHFVSAYQNSGADLVLSGHAHGGQIRLPLIGGLFAPGQGPFPRYTSGLYRLKNDVSLIVNRGLGDSLFPWRINNPPHMILITLRT